MAEWKVSPGGEALGYFLGGYVPPGLQTGTPFQKKKKT